MKTQPNFGPFYPTFGSVMEGRSFVGDTSAWYRFGFNRKEKDDEVNGMGNTIAFEARIYDSRLGRFLSIDLVWRFLPNRTPYMFADNSPIKHIDYLGLFKWENKEEQSKSPMLDNYLNTGIQTLLQNEDLKLHLQKLGKFSDEDLEEVFKYGKGPAIRIEDNVGGPHGFAGGKYDLRDNTIILDTELIKQLNSASQEDQQAALLSIVAILLHETVHYGRDLAIDPDNNFGKITSSDYQNGLINSEVNHLSGSETEEYRAWTDSEAGNVFQRAVYGMRFGDSETSRSAKGYLMDSQKFIRFNNINERKQTLIPNVGKTNEKDK